MQDQTIFCVQCDNPFTVTVSEQKRMESLGFDAPKRCPECRKNKQKPAKSENGRKKKGRKQHEPWEIMDDDQE